ncbi:heterokaryon incompatibility protein-domain-containing protein, partial [Halenospora varia]
EGIQPSTLPKTLGDANKMTRRLKYRYLWIDALCIIQDSREDWEAEVAKMGATFSNAAIMLCAARAARAADCRQGFLAPRPPIADAPLIFIWKEYSSADEDEEPIRERVWTLQERYLSPRILLFNENQITWECGSDNFTEGEGPYQVETPSNL